MRGREKERIGDGDKWPHQAATQDVHSSGSDAWAGRPLAAATLLTPLVGTDSVVIIFLAALAKPSGSQLKGLL